MPETDEVIYKRFLKERKDDDLRTLMMRHREGLAFFLFGFLHNMDDAEDIMLDTFAVAASGTSRFSGKSSFKTWLFSIGRNRAMKLLRKKKPFMFSVDETGGTEGTADSPEGGILDGERNRHLYKAMNELKDEYRQTLFLIYFEQMSIEEAAAVLKKTPKQVYNLSYRGKDALKKQLERSGFNYEEY